MNEPSADLIRRWAIVKAVAFDRNPDHWYLYEQAAREELSALTDPELVGIIEQAGRARRLPAHPDRVDVKLVLLRELIGALEEEREDKIVMWEIESTTTALTFFTLRFTLTDERMARVDAAALDAGLWVRDPIVISPIQP